MKNKIKKGAKLFLVNGSKYHENEWVEICRVARKYFYIKEYDREIPFYLDSLKEKSEYMPRQAYMSDKEYYAEKEHHERCIKISRYVQRYSLHKDINQEQSIQIINILGIQNEK